MLKAEELRIGNWLQDFSGKCSKWVYEDFDLLRHAEVDELAKPIPLTTEILEKSGFVKANTKQNDNIEFTFYGSKAVDNDIFSIRTDRMKELQRVLILPMFKNIALPVHLNTVHQLQNLYFALTGNELEINL